ncbi:MAG: GNAT family N-acetyltransferase [Ilumatobacteraceae bacterium]|jgi:RimJ/RimL family protein N-acetyltransferase
MIITTSRSVIRPVVPADYPQLHEIESDPTTRATWRYKDGVPPLEAYEEALWRQTQAIWVVIGRDTGRVNGYLQLHDVDLRAGHGWFSLYASPTTRGSGFVMEGLMAFCESVFSEWPIRWIYAHSLEQNVGAFESGIRRGDAVRLGVMHNRMIIDGVLSDVHVIGISRDNWMNSRLRERFNKLRVSEDSAPTVSR